MKKSKGIRIVEFLTYTSLTLWLLFSFIIGSGYGNEITEISFIFSTTLVIGFIIIILLFKGIAYIITGKNFVSNLFNWKHYLSFSIPIILGYIISAISGYSPTAPSTYSNISASILAFTIAIVMITGIKHFEKDSRKWVYIVSVIIGILGIINLL